MWLCAARRPTRATPDSQPWQGTLELGRGGAAPLQKCSMEPAPPLGRRNGGVRLRRARRPREAPTSSCGRGWLSAGLMLIAVRRGNDQKSMEGAPLNDECFNPDNLCFEVQSARLCINSCNNSTEIRFFFFFYPSGSCHQFSTHATKSLGKIEVSRVSSVVCRERRSLPCHHPRPSTTIKPHTPPSPPSTSEHPSSHPHPFFIHDT